MEINVKFPDNEWIKVIEVRLFLDGRVVTGDTPAILERYEELYGKRVRDYLQTLTLAVNQERESAYALRPPFREEEVGRSTRRYGKLGDFDLLFTNGGRRKITVSVEKKKEGWVSRLPFNTNTTIKLAEVHYKNMRSR